MYSHAANLLTVLKVKQLVSGGRWSNRRISGQWRYWVLSSDARNSCCGGGRGGT